MKKGIALLITLGFITLLTALIAYLFSINEELFGTFEDIDTINQSAILFEDYKRILDSKIEKIENDTDLEGLFLTIPPVVDPKSGLSTQVSIEPLSNKMDLNRIFYKGKIDKSIIKFLENVSEIYNISDIHFLISLILDTVDTDDEEREPYSEIVLEDKKFSNGKVVNSAHFFKLLNYYAKNIHDDSVLKVPWDKMVYFGSGKKGFLDCDRMSRELENALGLDIENFRGCDDLNTTQNHKIALDFNLKRYNKVLNYEILVKIGYQLDDKEDEISFFYDIKNKKVSNVESF